MVKEVKLFLCDRRRCSNCSYPECKHTTDFDYAENKDKMMHFKLIPNKYTGKLQHWEVEDPQ